MIKLTKLLTVVVMSAALFGCYNKGELKNLIQNEYDRMRALTKSGDFCFYLGEVRFPYDEVPIKKDELQYDIWNKEDLANTLPLFFELGLLEREPISANPVLYRYQLTPEGEKYQYLHPFHINGRVDNKNAFCYGKRVILAVTDVSERVVGDGVGNATQKKTVVDVKFNFEVKDYPDWAKSQELFNIYDKQYDLGGDENKSIQDAVRLIKRQDGLYDEGSIRQLMARPL